MNSRFDKYLKMLNQEGVGPEQLQETLDELHKSFATLTQEEQKYANIFLHETQSGDAKLRSDMTLRDYISEYQYNAKNDEINKLIRCIGVDEAKLRDMLNMVVAASNINEFGRFGELKETVDKTMAKAYFEKLEGKRIPPFEVNIRIHNILEEFIIRGGFEIDSPEGDVIYDEVNAINFNAAEESGEY